jgi:hypothetical protein
LPKNAGGVPVFSVAQKAVTDRFEFLRQALFLISAKRP